MSTEITDKNHVLVLRGNIDIYITQNEYELVEGALSQGSELFKVQGRLITKGSVLYVVSASDFKQVEMKKKGYWQCSAGNWHPKEFTECSC